MDDTLWKKTPYGKWRRGEYFPNWKGWTGIVGFWTVVLMVLSVVGVVLGFTEF